METDTKLIAPAAVVSDREAGEMLYAGAPVMETAQMIIEPVAVVPPLAAVASAASQACAAWGAAWA